MREVEQEAAAEDDELEAGEAELDEEGDLVLAVADEELVVRRRCRGLGSARAGLLTPPLQLVSLPPPALLWSLSKRARSSLTGETTAALASAANADVVDDR